MTFQTHSRLAQLRSGPEHRKSALFVAGQTTFMAAQFVSVAAIARIGSSQEVGAYFTATVICQLPVMFFGMNIRLGYVTDTRRVQRLPQYMLIRRWGTMCGATTAGCALLLWFGTGHAGAVAAAVLGARLVESYGNLEYAQMQTDSRLDFMGLSLAARGVGGAAVTWAVAMSTESVSWALFCQAGVWLILFFVIDRPYRMRSIGKAGTTGIRETSSLVRGLFPLALSTLVANALRTGPRLAVAVRWGEGSLGVLGPLLLGYGALSFLAQSVADSRLTRAVDLWKERESRRFNATRTQIMVFWLAIPIPAAVVLSYPTGELLRIVYGTEYVPVYPIVIAFISAAIVQIPLAEYRNIALALEFRWLVTASDVCGLLFGFSICLFLLSTGPAASLAAALLAAPLLQASIILIGIERRKSCWSTINQ